MKRRHYLAALGTVAVAGCNDSSSEQDSGGLEVTEVDSDTTTFGNVEVYVWIQNTASESRSETLVSQVDIQGGDTYTERRTITVPGNEVNSYTMDHDIDLSTSLSGGEYRYEAYLG